MPKTISVRIDDATAERAAEASKKFNISTGHIIKDAIENFLPYSDIPYNFLVSTGLSHILKKGIPIRSILPFTTSMLRYNMVSDFEININGRTAFINPYPEYSLLCGIKIIERLYQTVMQVNSIALGK